MSSSFASRNALNSGKSASQFDKIDRTFLRKLLRTYCTNDSDLDAFCVDRFGHIFKQYSSGMNRTQKENLLLININPQRMLNAIRAYVKDNLPDRFFDDLEREIANEFTKVNVAQHDIVPTAILKIAESQHQNKHRTIKKSSSSILVSSLALLTTLIIIAIVLFIINQITAKQPPLIFIIQSAPPEEWANYGPENMIFDTPEQFARKVRNIDPDKIRYLIQQRQDDDHQELLRLVLAILRATNTRFASTKYGQRQVTSWEHESTSEAQFLLQLDKQILKMLPEGKPLTNRRQLDLSVTAVAPLDMLQVPEEEPIASPQKKPMPAEPITPAIRNKADGSRADSILDQAHTYYVNGKFKRAIALAQSAKRDRPMRAWRILASAACATKNYSLLKDSYRRLDIRSREYIAFVCKRDGLGIRSDGKPFKLP